MLLHPPAKPGIPTTCLKPMPALVHIATAKLHMSQPKLINRPAQVLLPQPMFFCGTPMVIDAPPKETGGLGCLVYLIDGRNGRGKQLPHDDRNIGKMCSFQSLLVFLASSEYCTTPTLLHIANRRYNGGPRYSCWSERRNNGWREDQRRWKSRYPIS